jgi:hypothetical protein
MSDCKFVHDVLLAFVGGIIGFFSSYAQWKVSLKQQQREETRKQIERLICLVEKYNNYVSVFVNKRNHEQMYFGELEENPMPEILFLKDRYAPEITPLIDKIREIFRQNLPLVMIAPESVEPIHNSIPQIKEILLKKLQTI